MYEKDWYIAGPMSGLPDLNYPYFNGVEELLQGLGYSVENPARNSLPDGEHWIGFMRLGLAQLLRCRGIYLLNGWQFSRGARIEFNVASDLKMNVYFDSAAGWLPKAADYEWKEPYE